MEFSIADRQFVGNDGQHTQYFPPLRRQTPNQGAEILMAIEFIDDGVELDLQFRIRASGLLLSPLQVALLSATDRAGFHVRSGG